MDLLKNLALIIRILIYIIRSLFFAKKYKKYTQNLITNFFII